MKKKIYKKNNHHRKKIVYNTSTKHSNDENSFSTIDTKISDSTNEFKEKCFKKAKKYYSKTFLTNCDNYKGLSMNEKIYEMNNLHNSSEKRFKKYYGIFEQIKSEINDIQKNLNFSKTNVKNYHEKKFKCLTNVNSNVKNKKYLNDIEEKDEEYFISPEKKNNDSMSNFDNYNEDENNNQIINLINKFDQDDFNDMLNNNNNNTNNNNIFNFDNKDFYKKIYNTNSNNSNNNNNNNIINNYNNKNNNNNKNIINYNNKNKEKNYNKKNNNYYYYKKNKKNFFECASDSDKENNNNNNNYNDSDYCDDNLTEINENKKEIYVTLTTESDSMKNCRTRNKILSDKYCYNKYKTIFIKEDDNYDKNNKNNNSFCGCLCQ